MELDIEEIVNSINTTGDSTKFNPIVLHFQKQIFSFCYRMLRNRQEAEDMTQDVFVVAYENLKAYRLNHSFKAWLYKIAYNRCLNRIKRQKTYIDLLVRLPLKRLERSADHFIENNMFDSTILDAFSKLSVEEQSIINLRIFEEMEYDEIASIINHSAETTRRKYNRAKDKLKRNLKGVEMKHEKDGYNFN